LKIALQLCNRTSANACKYLRYSWVCLQFLRCNLENIRVFAGKPSLNAEDLLGYPFAI